MRVFDPIAIGANPSGTIGLTAVNGSAFTFLRSDGAPALSQAIAPTWTGSHAWSPAANTTPLTVSGYSVTGSGAANMVSLSGTFNTSGAPIGLNHSIVGTAFGTSARNFKFATTGIVDAAGNSQSPLFDMTPKGQITHTFFTARAASSTDVGYALFPHLPDGAYGANCFLTAFKVQASVTSTGPTSGAPTFGMLSFDMGSLGGTFADITGAGVSVGNIGASGTNLRLFSGAMEPGSVTWTNIDVYHSLIDDNFNGFTCTQLCAFHAADGGLWGGSTITRDYGILVEPSASGATNIWAGAFGGNVMIFPTAAATQGRLYWGAASTTAVASRQAGINYNTGTSNIEFDIATTIGLKAHSTGISLRSGVVNSELADAAISTSAAMLYVKDTITRTQTQNVLLIQETGVANNNYMQQLNTGEWTVGYSCAAQSGYILGFIAATSGHPSWATTPLSNGMLSYINHTEATLTPTICSGGVGLSFLNGASATTPTSTMAYMGFMGGAGSATDSSGQAGKKVSCLRTWFFAGSGNYRGQAIDAANNADSVRGNFDSAWGLFCDAQAYKFVKGGLATTTNKPGIVGSLRIPIQGMAGTTQGGIVGVNRIADRSTASGHVDENVNNCTNSFFMSVPFPSATATGARTTLRTTNAAHFAVEGYAAALGGPTWATWTNPEDSETNNYYGKYLDKGTNNPFGWYQHDGTSWQRQIGVVANGRFAAQTAAKTAATYTVPASDASFEISANILVTTATTHNFTCTCAYTDEGNTARTLTLSFTLVAGGAFTTAVANGNGAVPYMGIPQHIRCKAATTITIATVGTFTTVTYNVEGSIRALT